MANVPERQNATPAKPKKDTRRKFTNEQDECCLQWIMNDPDRLDNIWPGLSIPGAGQKEVTSDTLDELIGVLKIRFLSDFRHVQLESPEEFRKALFGRLNHLKKNKIVYVASRSDEQWKADKLSTVTPSLRIFAQQIKIKDGIMQARLDAQKIAKEENRVKDGDFKKPRKEKTNPSNSTSTGPAVKKQKGSKDDQKGSAENEKSDEQKRSESLVTYGNYLLWPHSMASNNEREPLGIDNTLGTSHSIISQDINAQYNLETMNDDFFQLLCKYWQIIAALNKNPYDIKEATMLTEKIFNDVEKPFLEQVAALIRARYADILQFFDDKEQDYLVEFKSFYSGVIKTHYNLDLYNVSYKNMSKEEQPTFTHMGRIYPHPAFYINKGEVAEVFPERNSVTKRILTRILEPLYDEVCDIFTQAAEANLEQIDMVYLNALMFLEYVGETARGKQNRRAINDAIRQKKEILTKQICEWKETKAKELHGENASFDGPNYVQKICGLQANIARLVSNYQAYVKAARFMGLIAVAAVPDHVKAAFMHIVHFFTLAKESFESLTENLFQSCR
ncbi:hypothetical protein Ddc_19102 [Ditylenchus destructor]|nr:hypothetical protein Ddc_19102 [Ditylenchus destructor]